MRISPYAGGQVDVDHLAERLATLQAHPEAGFLVAEYGAIIHGVLVLIVTDDLLTRDRLASEVCWYVDPEHRDGVGIALLSAGEQWARARGATRMQMLAPVRKFASAFRRRGYVGLSQVFERRL